jgi:hypothetical protein
MIDRIEAWRRRNEGRVVVVGKSVIAVAMIAGCSWVPDVVNPVEWYKGVASTLGSDEPAPEIATPRRPEGSFPNVNAQTETERKALQKGLVADRGNSKYADPVKREPTPTKALARRTPAPAPTQVAEAAPAPAPAAEMPPADDKNAHMPSLDKPMVTARDEGPAAPPQVAPAGPPAKPEIPETIPTKRSLLTDHYQRRLAESSAATTKDDPFRTMPAARPDSSYDQPVHTYAVPAVTPASYVGGYGGGGLTPPKGVGGTRGARGAVVPSGPAASFQVADVQFADGGGGLTAADRASLREVAQLQKRTGGVVRILGQYTPTAISFANQDPDTVAMARARAVAKALTGMGVPAGKVKVAADPAGAGWFGDSGAKVSIEY